MTRYHDSHRFISNDNSTPPDPARDIPISRAVGPDRRARYVNLIGRLSGLACAILTALLLLRPVSPTSTVEVWRTQRAR